MLHRAHSEVRRDHIVGLSTERRLLRDLQLMLQELCILGLIVLVGRLEEVFSLMGEVESPYLRVVGVS